MTIDELEDKIEKYMELNETLMEDTNLTLEEQSFYAGHLEAIEFILVLLEEC